MSKKCSTNSEYQAKQRSETISLIIEAADDLRCADIPITKTALAKETGLHRNTLNQPYLKDTIDSLIAQSSDIQPIENDDVGSELKIKQLEEKLRKSLKANQNLREENLRLKVRYSELEKDFEHLLWKRNKDIDSKSHILSLD